MLKKGSKLNSILTGSCPRCQKESMYVESNPYSLTKILKMHEHCSHCKLRYQIDPSFFYGAMYVSYGLNVIIGIVTFLVTFLLMHLSLQQSFISIIVMMILPFPLVLRWSRNIYINLFISYEPEAAE